MNFDPRRDYAPVRWKRQIEFAETTEFDFEREGQSASDFLIENEILHGSFSLSETHFEALSAEVAEVWS
jgi:hypothetical protein